LSRRKKKKDGQLPPSIFLLSSLPVRAASGFAWLAKNRLAEPSRESAMHLSRATGKNAI
jgi:hypothetical protein